MQKVARRPDKYQVRELVRDFPADYFDDLDPAELAAARARGRRLMAQVEQALQRLGRGGRDPLVQTLVLRYEGQQLFEAERRLARIGPGLEAAWRKDEPRRVQLMERLMAAGPGTKREQLAAELGVPVRTLYRYLRLLKKSGDSPSGCQ